MPIVQTSTQSIFKQISFVEDLPAWGFLSTRFAPETHLPFPYIDSGVYFVCHY